MICESCRTAGDMNVDAAKATQDFEPDHAKELLEGAIELHALCPGQKACNCQHRVGVFVKQ